MNRPRVATFLGVAGCALLFAVVTQHAWEDYYITYRPSKNLVQGHGLVFQPGERVHTFTSPINVLLPALLAFVTGDRSDELVLWLYRIVSACALGWAAVLLLRVGERLGLQALTRGAMVLALCVELKTVDFSVNGQESGFMALFMALALDALTLPEPRAVVRLALAFTGLMWTRPDGFVYGAALALALWLFPTAGTLFSGARGLRRLAVAGALGAALYLPWFLWSWSYYGSPVPHTILAKRALVRPEPLASMLSAIAGFPLGIVDGSASTFLTFLPIYMDRGGWDYRFIAPFGSLTGMLCALYWLWPFASRLARVASLAFMLCHFYLSVVVPYVFPWYLPSTAVIGLVVLAAMAQDGLDYSRRIEGRARALGSVVRVSVAVAGVLLLASMLGFYLASARELRLQQTLIEDGNRKQIGLWLKENARTPRDTVFLEPLGYIGYFSGLKMYDFPGLSSPEVVGARWRLKTNLWAPLIRELTPDWLVLRPGEMFRIWEADRTLLRESYDLVRFFDQGPALDREKWVAGRSYLKYDSQFMVFRRRETPSP